MFDGLPLNSSIITDNRDNNICSPSWNPQEYKTILDIVYMLGTFLGAETFHLVGEAYGVRFSLGLALFTTFLGSSLGLLWKNIWSVSFS